MTQDGLPSAPWRHHVGGLDRLGPPVGGPAPELIDSGFSLENADAPLLHAGLNHADLAHVLDLHERGVIPGAAARQIVRVLLRARRPRRRTSRTTPPSASPTTPGNGSSLPDRRRCRLAPRGSSPTRGGAHRPAVPRARRSQTSSPPPRTLPTPSPRRRGAHSRTWLPDQTYLQHAQPSTFGHYLRAFAYPVLRDGGRLVDALTWINTSPGGAGCVNGSRLLDDRDAGRPAARLRRRHPAPATRCGRSTASSPLRPMPRCPPRRASSVRTSRSGRAASSTT